MQRAESHTCSLMAGDATPRPAHCLRGSQLNLTPCSSATACARPHGTAWPTTRPHRSFPDEDLLKRLTPPEDSVPPGYKEDKDDD